MRHPLVEPANEQQHRHVGGQHHVGEGRHREGDRNRHAGQHRHPDDQHEEDQQIGIAQAFHIGVRQWRIPRRQGRHRDDADHHPCGKLPEQPRHRDQDHQPEPHRQGRREPRLRYLQPRHQDTCDLLDILDRGPQHDREEHKARRRRVNLQRHPPRRSHAGDQRGHAHVLAAVERHRRTDHAEPKEHGLGQFVGPDQRTVQHVARNHAQQQDDDLRHHQQRRNQFQHTHQRPLERGRKGSDPCLAPRHRRGTHMIHRCVSPPTALTQSDRSACVRAVA